MKNKSAKKNHFIIRKRLCFLGSLSLILTLSFLLWSYFDYTPNDKVHAAENSEQLYKGTLEQYLRTNELYTWKDYSNLSGRTRAERVAVFTSYFSNWTNAEVANSYGWPIATHYSETEVNTPYNGTSAAKDHDLYLVEFSTNNNVKKKNIDI